MVITHLTMPERMRVGKRYSAPNSIPVWDSHTKRTVLYIATIYDLDPKLIALTVEWENSHNFCAEILGSYLRYDIDCVDSILLSDEL